MGRASDLCRYSREKKSGSELGRHRRAAAPNFDRPSDQGRLRYYWYLSSSQKKIFDANWPAIVQWYVDTAGKFQQPNAGKPDPVVYLLPDAPHYFYISGEAFVVLRMREFLVPKAESLAATYKAVENSPDGDDRFRSRSGPLPIRTRRPNELNTETNRLSDCHVHAALRSVRSACGLPGTAVGEQLARRVLGHPPMQTARSDMGTQRYPLRVCLLRAAR